MINVDLLRRVLTHITIHPEVHNQRFWGKKTPCGTAGCVAGHVGYMQGYVPVWEPYEKDETGTVVIGSLEGFLKPGTDPKIATNRAAAVDHDAYLSAADVGQVELGLTEHQADMLFDGDNSLDRLWELADQLTLGEINGADRDQAESVLTWEALEAEREELRKQQADGAARLAELEESLRTWRAPSGSREFRVSRNGVVYARHDGWGWCRSGFDSLDAVRERHPNLEEVKPAA